jgi:hypothetical protein
MNKDMEIKMNTWYEVFITNKNGSHTLDTFDTLKEAKAFKEYIFRKINDNEGILHIDKWQNIDNPTIIKAIE